MKDKRGPIGVYVLFGKDIKKSLLGRSFLEVLKKVFRCEVKRSKGIARG
ncbi:hypothetical protein KO529_11265 [Arenibacter algicola]|nr:hypothetical protein [Arenibacter algicola]MBU2905365.1 hypothetical protein [Arenibacter algicola]